MQNGGYHPNQFLKMQRHIGACYHHCPVSVWAQVNVAVGSIVTGISMIRIVITVICSGLQFETPVKVIFISAALRGVIGPNVPSIVKFCEFFHI